MWARGRFVDLFRFHWWFVGSWIEKIGTRPWGGRD